jgi:hypothetical protein
MRKISVAAALAACLAVHATRAPAQDVLSQVGAAQLESARAAARSAEAVVIGPGPGADYWLRLYAQNSDANLHALQAGDFNYLAAVAELKRQAATIIYRGAATQNVMREVYGRDPYGEEYQHYKPLVDAQQAWFVTIRTQEMNRMNSDPYLRRQTIERVYVEVFGRVPTQTDLGYWMPRKDTYRAMYDANMAYLYAHPADLSATAARAWEVTYQASPTGGQVAELVAAARAGHLDYPGMLQWIRSRH